MLLLCLGLARSDLSHRYYRVSRQPWTPNPFVGPGEFDPVCTLCYVAEGNESPPASLDGSSGGESALGNQFLRPFPDVFGQELPPLVHAPLGDFRTDVLHHPGRDVGVVPGVDPAER